MEIIPLRKDLAAYAKKHQIEKHYEKQKQFFEINPMHRSLETEILEPHHLRIYSFRITKKYRAVFIYRGSNAIEIIDINNHYS